MPGGRRKKKDSGFPLSFSLIENSERILVRFWQYMNSKKPRRVCRPQAAKSLDHFSPRHVRGEKYLSDCKCGIFALRAKIMRAAGCKPLGRKNEVFSPAALIVLAHAVAHAHLCEDILRLAGILLYLTADIGHVHPEDLIVRLGLGAP